MAFENKDLLTKLLPQISERMGRGCWLHSLICQWPTLHCHAATNCHNITVTACGPTDACRGLSVPTLCDGKSVPTRHFYCLVSTPFVIEHQEDLIAVRQELVDTLRKLDKLQHDGLPSSMNSLAEAAELEETLKRQLEHVRQVRKELE
jgi:hypothetical protein